VPLLTFTGVEGKTFSPMAITVMLALAGAFIASLTFVPAMVALLIRGEVAEKEVKAIAWVKERYEPVLKRVIARPWPWIGAGAGTFAAAGLVFLMLGSEFIPQLGEGNLAMQAHAHPSTSLNKSQRCNSRSRRRCR
jgi:cobalt-zinc-cadmium resistance protein CzcA